MKIINLGELGLGYRELGELAEMLTELADNGKLYGQEFDLDSLHIGWDDKRPEVILFDDYGATTEEEEEEEW